MIVLIFSVGCGADEQPLVPDEEKPLEIEIVGGQSPEGQIPQPLFILQEWI